MPFDSIGEAKKAKFPTTKDKINLDLLQINKLAEFYDAIKKAGSADNPMAVAWDQWKKLFKKEGKKWVLIKKEGEQETDMDWVPVAKAEQVKRMLDGSKVILTEQALKNSVESWKNGDIIINHKEKIDGLKIIDALYKAPFLYMKFNECTNNIFKNTDATGWSVQFVAGSLERDGERILNGTGQGVSILYPPHAPTCTPEMGCFETFDFKEGEFGDYKMEEKNEQGLKKMIEDLKAGFEGIKEILKGVTLIRSKKEEENQEQNLEEKENMDKQEQMTSELKTATAALTKSQSEFETMQTDHAKEVKELGDKVAAFEQEKIDAAKAELSAQWEQLKKEVIPPGLVAKGEDADKLKGEFEQHPYAFIQRMTTFKKEEDKKEEGAEFESATDESKVALKELKEDTGRI